MPGLFGYVVNGTFVGVSTTTAAPVTTTPGPTPTAVPSNTTDNSTSTVPPTTTAAPPMSVDPSVVVTLYNNTYILAIDATSMTHLCLQADGTLQDCSSTNIPPGVCYFITTNGTIGIADMQVQFVFRDITASYLPLVQRLNVSYNSGELVFCQASTQILTQAFEVSQTVSFVDVSQSAIGIAGESPVFLLKVPNDFFYPFLYYTSGSERMSHTLVPVISLAIVSLYSNCQHCRS